MDLYVYILLSISLNSSVRDTYPDRGTPGVTYTYIYVYNKQEILGGIDHLLSFHYILSVWYDTNRIEKTASNSSSIVACVFVAAGTCLPSLCLPTAVSSVSTIPAFRLRGGGTDTQTAR
jgi:hypothetical protein